MKALYITNLGILDNLGQTQILPYLIGLSKKGIEIRILSFEKTPNLSDRRRVEDTEKRLKDAGVEWERLSYHRRWGNLWDVFAGFIKAFKITIIDNISVIHARATIPVLIAWPLAKILGRRIIYDRRGTMVGDFVDDVNINNIFSIGFFSFAVNAIDRFIMRHSDAVVALSDRAAGMLEKDWYVSGRTKIIKSIPCCADISKFRNSGMTGPSFDLNGRFVMSYVGSLGTCYLLKEMIDFFMALKKQKGNAVFLVISHTDRVFIEGALKRQGLLPEKDYLITSASPDEVPGYLARCDFSIMFIKDVDCKIGSSPTKFAESLAAGMPVVVNKGIGDTENVISAHKVGVVVDGLNAVSYKEAVIRLLSLLDEGDVLRRRCVETAGRYFSLDLGIKRYEEIYAGLRHGI